MWSSLHFIGDAFNSIFRKQVQMYKPTRYNVTKYSLLQIFLPKFNPHDSPNIRLQCCPIKTLKRLVPTIDPIRPHIIVNETARQLKHLIVTLNETKPWFHKLQVKKKLKLYDQILSHRLLLLC